MSMSSPGTNPPWHVLLTSSRGGHHKNQHRCREWGCRERETGLRQWWNACRGVSLLRNILLWWRILDATVSRDILYIILFNYAQLPLNLSRCSFRQSIQFFISLSLSLFALLFFFCLSAFAIPISIFNFSPRFLEWIKMFNWIFAAFVCEAINASCLLSLSLSTSFSVSLSFCLALWPLQSVPCCAWRVDFWITIFINLCIWNWQVSLFSLVSVYMECAASFLSAMICVLCTICSKSVRLSNFESYTVIQNVYLGYCMSFK